MAEQAKPKLGYWRIRGITQPIRLILKYTNTPFEDVLYVQGDGPEFSRKSWLDVKFTLGLEFPNLPYYIDGDFKITESSAIIRYIADKNNLLGKDPETRARARMLEDIMIAWRIENAEAAFSSDFELMKDSYLAQIDKKFIPNFVAILEKTEWAAGDEITYVDFMLYEYSCVAYAMEPSFREKYHKLVEHSLKIEALPAIKSYIESAEYLSLPFYNKFATWGSKAL